MPSFFKKGEKKNTKPRNQDSVLIPSSVTVSSYPGPCVRVRVRDLLRVPFSSRCPHHSHLLFFFLLLLLGVNPPCGRVPVSPLGPELGRTVGLEAAGAGNGDDAPPPAPPPALLLLLMVILLSRSCVQRCEKLSGKNKL